jgi:hypothetical protein
LLEALLHDARVDDLAVSTVEHVERKQLGAFDCSHTSISAQRRLEIVLHSVATHLKTCLDVR